jgi:hypothetical protein
MKKLNWENYFERTISIRMQFELASKVFSTFKKTPEALKKYSDGELRHLREILQEHFDKSGKSPTEHWAFSEEGVRKYLNEVQSNVQEQLVNFENSIKQSELILRVSLFEIFMKEIHRHILKQKPTLLKADKQIPLGRALSLGFEKVINEEIEKEVHSLDKAKYFKEKLGIDWFEGKAVPLLEHVIDVRNSILHEDPNRKVDEIDMGLTIMMCTAIPFVCIAQAAVLYPKGFKMIKGMKKSKIRKLMNPNSIRNIHLEKPKNSNNSK